MTQELTILARLEEQMRHMNESFSENRRSQDERWKLIEPIVLERSRDIERHGELKADVDNLGGKIRSLTVRVEKLESRLDRTVWLALGAFAAIQFLYSLLEPRIARLIGG